MARQLGVSVKTVDFHLGNIYRKLSIASRGELAHLVGRGTVGAAEALPSRNLPRPRTALIGRDVDAAALIELLAAPGLVTVLGPGGVGKTQLTLTAAQALDLDSWFVDLVSTADPDGVVPVVARSLGLRRVSTPVEAATALAGVRGLLVLDCCEHVLDGVRPLVQQLSESCRSLTIVATSRARLRLAGERVFSVRPLRVEAERGTVAPASELFRLRWRALDPAAAVVAEDEAVERVCARLDGLPLAIELAVARLRAFDLAALEEALGDLSTVSGSDGRAEDRHRSLAATIGWSFELLTPEERRAFEALSVFGGTFDLEAARTMITGPRPTADEVLLSLVDKSLVVTDHTSGSMRYRILDTVREFVWANVRREGSDVELRCRFVAHAVRWVAAADADVRGPEDARGHRAFTEDWHNVRSAIATAIDLDDVESAYRLLAHCMWWVVTRTRVDLDELVERALGMTGGDRHTLRPTVSSGAATMAAFRNDKARAKRHLARAFEEDALAGQAGEPWPACTTTVIADETRDSMADAQSILDRRSVRGDPFWRMVGLFQQGGGYVYALQNLPLDSATSTELVARLRSNLAEAERHRNPNGIGYGTALLGAAFRLTDPLMARRLLERAIDLAAPLEIENTTTWAQRELCLLHRAAGHHRRVVRLAAPAIRRHLHAGSFSDGRPLTYVTLSSLIALGHGELAARAFGSLERDYDAGDMLLPVAEIRSELHAALGPAEVNRLTALGRLDEIQVLSREVADVCDRLLAAPKRVIVREHRPSRRLEAGRRAPGASERT